MEENENELKHNDIYFQPKRKYSSSNEDSFKKCHSFSESYLGKCIICYE